MKLDLTPGQRAKAVVAGIACGLFGERRSAGQCFASALTGHYDIQRDRYRFRPPNRLESIDVGLKYGVRDDFISEARRLDQTFGIVGAIKEKYAQHVVGACRLIWNTGVPEVDAAYRQLWNDSLNTLDASGNNHGTKMTELIVKSVLGDGAVGNQIINQPGRPVQVRQIERDRIRSSAGLIDVESDEWFGGIRIEKASGRRMSYRVWDRNRYGLFENMREIPAGDFIFVYDPDRIDDSGGITKFKCTLNPLTDLKETVEAEHLSVKRNSKLALLVKTLSGGARTVADELFQGGADATTGTGADNSAKISSQIVNNAVDAYMFPDESMTAHESPRPANGWFGLMEWRVQEIAVALNLPVAFVWKMAQGSTGPLARADLVAAGKTFRKFHYQVVWLSWLRKIAGIIIARGISDGTVPFHPNWTRFRSIPPASPSIDNGRDTTAGIAAIEACIDSIDAWIEEAGEDAEDVIDGNILFISRLKAKAEAAGLKLEDVRTSPNKPLAQPMQQQKAAA